MKKIIISALLLVTSLFAELKVGDAFPSLTLVDQFDEKVEVQREGATTLMLSFEKDVSSGIKAFLETKDKNFLNDNNITYIADISKMPSFVTNWFALPKMKKFDFKVALIYDEEAGQEIPRQEEKVSVITLKDNNITAMKFVEPKALEQLLK